MADFIHHEPCPSCGSRDNLARYSDGSAFCFGCRHLEVGDNQPPSLNIDGRQRKGYRSNMLEQGEIKALSKRRLDRATCEKFNYFTSTHNGTPCQVANFTDKDGIICAQKVRYPSKDFKFLGSPKEAILFGQNLWSAGGKKVVITEGEIDALSMSQVQGLKWPVVSLKNGAQGAKKDLQGSLEWLETFDEVILMFDQDEPGVNAANEAATLFTPGKVKIARLPLKDPNEMLVAGRGHELITAMWQAHPWRPDGIITASDLRSDVLKEPEVQSIPYPWEGLNEKTHGLRLGELVTITAGTGVGKSAVVRELAYYLHQQRSERVGLLMLEEKVTRAAKGILGLHLNQPLHISKRDLSDEEIAQAFDEVFGKGENDMALYDHFGSTSVENILSRIRYMAKGLGCKWVILDHLSIVISGLDGGDDERKLIDRAMTQLRTLVEDTGIGLILVSHLRRSDGTPHEEGGQTSLSQLRGSHAIAQLSDMVLGIERNQQGPNPHLTTVRVLKNRFSGDSGVGCYLEYDTFTGRLSEVPPPKEDGEEDETF